VIGTKNLIGASLVITQDDNSVAGALCSISAKTKTIHRPKWLMGDRKSVSAAKFSDWGILK